MMPSLIQHIKACMAHHIGENPCPCWLYRLLSTTEQLAPSRSHSTETYDFTESDIALATNVTTVAGQALQRAHLYEALEVELAERKRMEAVIRDSEARYRSLFEDSPISLWEEDFSQVKVRLDDLTASGVDDMRAYLEKQPHNLWPSVLRSYRS